MRNFCNLIGLEQWHFSLISRFMEDVNKRQGNFLNLSGSRRNQPQGNLPTLDIFSELELTR